MNESCHTYEWVMSHIWISHFTHMNESCHTYEWAMSEWIKSVGVVHIRDRTVSSFIYVTGLIHHSYMWQDWFISKLWWISPVTYVNAIGWVEVCSYGWVTACLTHLVPWEALLSPIHTDLYMWHQGSQVESRHTYEWVMSQVWIFYVTDGNENCDAYEWVMSHIWMRHVSHKNKSCLTYEWLMSHIEIAHPSPEEK